MSPKQGSVHFNIDKAVLRDIIEARSVRDKQSFYYIVGSIFSGMSFTMLLLKSDNYSAITFLTMIGIFFYTCISCHNVHYDKDEDVIETDSDENTDVDPQPTPTNTPMMQGLTGLDETDSFELNYLTKGDKVILFKQLFHELVGADFSDSDLERLIDRSEEMAMDEVCTEEIPEKEEEEGAVDSQTKVLAQLRQVEAETAARNLARAQTSFSDSELRQLEEPVIEGKEKTL